MKLIGRVYKKGESTILICQESYLFGLIKIKRSFIATEMFIEGFWRWKELPDRTLVPDNLSFQLDSWNRDFINGHIKI